MFNWLLCTGRDIIEIIFFSTIIYYFSLWLKKDRQKKLLLYFYSYSTLLFIAYHAELTTISHFFYAGSAFAILFFIFIHQHTLQKNFIALQTLTPSTRESHDWLEALTQSALIALNNNKSFSCVLERSDSMATLLDTQHPLYAHCTKNLFELLMQSKLYDHNKMLWVNNQGVLVGVNASWLYNRQEQIPMPESHDHDAWLADALFFSTKSDALICITVPATRTVTIIVQGKYKDKLAMPEAHAMMKKYFGSSLETNRSTTKETTHAYTNTHTPHTQQRTP